MARRWERITGRWTKVSSSACGCTEGGGGKVAWRDGVASCNATGLGADQRWDGVIGGTGVVRLVAKHRMVAGARPGARPERHSQLRPRLQSSPPPCAAALCAYLAEEGGGRICALGVAEPCKQGQDRPAEPGLIRRDPSTQHQRLGALGCVSWQAAATEHKGDGDGRRRVAGPSLPHHLATSLVSCSAATQYAYGCQHRLFGRAWPGPQHADRYSFTMKSRAQAQPCST
eukprot:scaffold11561_cov99-Isochrysis_galbana.AAC.2